MDLMTVLGAGVGLGAVYVVMLHGEILGLLYNPMAIILVFGGTFGSTFISYPFSMIKKIPKLLFFVVFPPKVSNSRYVIKEVLRLAKNVKSNGVASLAEESSKDDFINSGLQMILENLPPEEIRENLMKEIEFSQDRHRQYSNVFRTMGTYSPIFGLLGTLIGVIQVMRNLTNPEVIGTSMSVAITTTFYGIFAANFIFIPVVNKLMAYSDKEALAKKIAGEGLLAIQKGEGIYKTERKLELFLSQQYRKNV